MTQLKGKPAASLIRAARRYVRCESDRPDQVFLALSYCNQWIKPRTGGREVAQGEFNRVRHLSVLTDHQNYPKLCVLGFISSCICNRHRTATEGFVSTKVQVTDAGCRKSSSLGPLSGQPTDRSVG